MTVTPIAPPHRRRPRHLSRHQVSHLGWLLCSGRAGAGLTEVVPSRSRLRVLVGELPTDRAAEDVSRELRGAARNLLGVAAELSEVADALGTWVSGRTGGRPSLALVDLYDDGRADIVCRSAPSLLLQTADHIDILNPAMLGNAEVGTTLTPGDRLFACSASFLEAVPPRVLATLPDLTTRSGPAGLVDHLTRAATPSRPARFATAAGVAVVIRGGPRSATGTQH
jgi:hypothetical protein